MQPVFPRIFNAIRFTIEYFKSGKISDNMIRMSGKGWQGANPKTHVEWYDLVLNMHQDMEDEILQIVNTSNHITLVTMFEYLKDWSKDYRFKNGANKALLLHEVNEYNKRIYEDFLERTEQKEKEFHAKRDLSKAHLEENEVDISNNYLALMPNSIFASRKITFTNYIYYCIDEIPEFLDMAYFDEYVNWVNDLILNFNNKVQRHIRLYDEGKYIAFDTIKVAQIQIANTPQTSYPLLENSKSDNKRLKVNLSVEQLTFLFRLLKDSKFIDSKLDKEIHAFIADNFETVGMEGKKISVKNVSKLFSSKDPDIINFWVAKFIELRNKSARK